MSGPGPGDYADATVRFGELTRQVGRRQVRVMMVRDNGLSEAEFRCQMRLEMDKVVNRLLTEGWDDESDTETDGSTAAVVVDLGGR